MSAGSRSTRDGQHGTRGESARAWFLGPQGLGATSRNALSAPAAVADVQDSAKPALGPRPSALVPVSERVEGQTVRGPVMSDASFEGYVYASLLEVRDGVAKLRAQRDELARCLRLALCEGCHFLYGTVADGAGCDTCSWARRLIAEASK